MTPTSEHLEPRPRVMCDECGETFPAPRTSFDVYREGLCPSCDTWLEMQFTNGKFDWGHNVSETHKEG